jgi:hypothetical protein
MGGVIPVQSGDIRQLNYVLVEDIHLAQGLDADTKSLRWLLFRQAGVVRVNVLRSNIKRLSIHRSRGFIPSHLATLVCLSEKTGNSFGNVFAKLHRCGCNTNCCPSNTLIRQLVGIRTRFVTGASHVDSVDGNERADRASRRDFPEIRLWITALTNLEVLRTFNATPYAVSNEKTHRFTPKPNTQLLTDLFRSAQGGAA